MIRSSKAITLTLIGSAFLAAGCRRSDEQEQNPNQQVAGGGRGVYIAPRIGGGVGGSVGVAPSARGGFGATGSSSVGS